MKDYKRVTIRHEDGSHSFMYDYNATTPPIKILLDRLAEPEDKIENRMRVDLPCKVGDTIYEVFKNHKPPFIQQTKVEKIIITEKGLKLKLARNSVYETSIVSLGKTLFLTEAKALKKLKEVEQTI